MFHAKLCALQLLTSAFLWQSPTQEPVAIPKAKSAAQLPLVLPLLNEHMETVEPVPIPRVAMKRPGSRSTSGGSGNLAPAGFNQAPGPIDRSAPPPAPTPVGTPVLAPVAGPQSAGATPVNTNPAIGTTNVPAPTPLQAPTGPTATQDGNPLQFTSGIPKSRGVAFTFEYTDPNTNAASVTKGVRLWFDGVPGMYIPRTADNKYLFRLANLSNAVHRVAAQVIGIDESRNSPVSDTQFFELRRYGLSIYSTSATTLIGPRSTNLSFIIRFSPGNKLKSATGFTLTALENQQIAAQPSVSAPQDSDNSVTLTLGTLTPGRYQLTIPTATIEDQWGNKLNETEAGPASGPVTIDLLRMSDETFVTVPGVRDSRGPLIQFPEYTAPRKATMGFNPDDHVEARVSRLYYYRDAHRVAQIINRRIQSYNRAAVEVTRQLADKARAEADAKTDNRRMAEVRAVRQANRTREVETRLSDINAQYNNATIENNQRAADLRAQLAQLNEEKGTLEVRKTRLLSDKSAADAAVETHDAQVAARTTNREAQKTARDQDLQREKDAINLRTDLTANQKNDAVAVLQNNFDITELGIKQTQIQEDLQSSQEKSQLLQQQTLVGQEQARVNGQYDLVVGRFTAANSELTTIQSAVATSEQRRVQEINQLQNNLQTARDSESTTNEQSITAQASEDRAREEQWRREVAASMEDPDTFAPGDPHSIDPVAQVSVSVIGEGVIHLRGPIKGVNIVRLMINDIDAPVGQTRIGVHTVQVNGQRGDRMEKVASRIQTYIDQSRFLTMQSVQLLRKTIVKVAAERAACDLPASVPAGTQAERDHRYLVAFFGSEFIQELESIDSEFLHTGNKLLSLHSMDSTSLASALFILALAKNEVRRQVLEEFQMSLQTYLPEAESNFIAEYGTACDKHCGQKAKYELLSCAARFQSLRGFFDAEFANPEGLNPAQREFIRLAQIFKARLVTEMEYRQRITERAVIEERLLGNYTQEEVNQKAYNLEEAARLAHFAAIKEVSAKRQEIQGALVQFRATATSIMKALEDAESLQSTVQQVVNKVGQIKEPKALVAAAEAKRSRSPSSQMLRGGRPAIDIAAWNQELETHAFDGNDGTKQQVKQLESLRQQMLSKGLDTSLVLGESGKAIIDVRSVDRSGVIRNLLVPVEKPEETIYVLVKQMFDLLSSAYIFKNPELQTFNELKTLLSPDTGTPTAAQLVDADKAKGVSPHRRVQQISELLNHIRRTGDSALAFENRISEVIFRVDRLPTANMIADLMSQTALLKGEIVAGLVNPADARSAFESVEAKLRDIGTAVGRAAIAQEELQRARRPLDHKKFLDMLIGEMEDKLIELLEGTRAHTANIDNYIKMIATALDDDINRQFYQPAFCMVRRASRFYDVELGQIETTTVLTNNRAFAKVSPQATMEFDLPRRDILVKEAMQGAKAMVQDYGALLQDPTFLSLSKLGSGSPTSSVANGLSGRLNPVRNVLPGLPGSSEERILSQQGAGDRELGSALEALIPDPAIYKFETGTGFEIRPVIQPDGQAVVFDFNYMYTTNVREPVRADEKHLGRIKRHFIKTDVQLSNYELREVSKYQVALKAARTGKGVPLLEDIPGVGLLFRPLNSDESSLQENLVYAQATIFPTLFDLMGLRWAQAVADLDSLRLQTEEFTVRGRQRHLRNKVFDIASQNVDTFLRTPDAERRPDLYRPQEIIPSVHPNGYNGPGMDIRQSQLQEGYDPGETEPGASPNGLLPRGPGVPPNAPMPRSDPEGSKYRPPLFPQLQEPYGSNDYGGGVSSQGESVARGQRNPTRSPYVAGRNGTPPTTLPPANGVRRGASPNPAPRPPAPLIDPTPAPQQNPLAPATATEKSWEFKKPGTDAPMPPPAAGQRANPTSGPNANAGKPEQRKWWQFGRSAMPVRETMKAN